MKIAAVSTFLPRMCGVAYPAHNLFNELRAQGHELVTFGLEESLSDFPVRSRTFRGMWEAARIIRRKDIRHVSIQYILPFFGKKLFGLNFLMFLILLRGRRVIVTMHEVHRFHSLGRLARKPADLVHMFLEAAIARLASGVIVFTDTQAKDLRRLGAPNIRRIYLGIRLSDVPRERTHLSRALFFGKLVPAKGVHLFAGIARLCPEIHFTIASSVEPQHAGYRDQLARDFAGIPNITFVCKDWFEDEEKERYFAEADVLVLPYIDTFYQSGVAAESGSYNIPNIVPRLGPLSEVTQSFHTGETLETSTPEAVRDAIRKVFKNYPRYLEGIRRYREEATWAAAARQYAEFLRDGSPRA